jgi:hypothetical protein
VVVATALLFAGCIGVPSASATQFNIGDVQVTVSGAATAGTAIRTEQPNPAIVPLSNAAAVGLFGAAMGGRNQDDGNLNFRRGDAVATVAKGMVQVEAKVGDYGVFVRGMGWRDFALADDAHPWGNLPNNFTPGPLGESSNTAYGRYTGVALLDANVYGNVAVAGLPLHLRVGRQSIPWGVPTTLSGGFSAINAINVYASRWPGILPEEVNIPFPAAFARLGVTSAINFEAYYQFAFQRSEPLGCGNFYNIIDYVADRCDKLMLGGPLLNDRQSLALGNFVKRAPDLPVSDGDQFGAGLTYRADALATRFGAYFAQYHSRGGLVGAIKAGRPVPFIVGDPDNLNPRYFIQYPESIRVLGANAVTSTPVGAAFAEVAHRPNQPLQLHSLDLTNAFLSPTAPSLLRAEINALPLGAPYRAYDRYATTDVILGFGKPLPGLLGAKVLQVGAEVGVKFVHDLPDPTQRRYGRSDVFGGGPVNGVCPAANPISCSNDGFVSSTASGARGRAALTYANVLDELDVIPSVSYGYDIHGWSYDGLFSEGRHIAVLALRAEYKKRFAAELSFTPLWGGRYSNIKDRDVATFAVSARF